MSEVKVYKTIVDVERSHRNLAKGYHAHEVFLKTDKRHEEIILKSDHDAVVNALKFENKMLKTHFEAAVRSDYSSNLLSAKDANDRIKEVYTHITAALSKLGKG